MSNVKWRVSPKPTGPYGSFQWRGWPTAYQGEELVAMIQCVDDYVPAYVKVGRHQPLKLIVRHHGDNGKHFSLKRRFLTLTGAKAALKEFLKAHPEFLPS